MLPRAYLSAGGKKQQADIETMHKMKKKSFKKLRPEMRGKTCSTINKVWNC